ncbi:hypothetical protein EXIGLDRAFT_729993 [Exidia glandulosa HHB12029]|uniref:Uncharacterized protein n=1 Tax=Exidia glandulosa HHB12029 TaxID=1314781 RepID=A0A165CCN1_EXIGL|nr:hypothetical protein EXIGLDRAFT_729993 [Exidia glandulosa HHB12029]
MPLAAQVQPLLAPLLLRAAREIATPWNATLTCDDGPNGFPRCTSPASTVLFRGSPTSTLLMTNDVCTVPHAGQLMLYVLLQALLTALWGVVAVGLERLIRRWRTRPKPWSASARTLGRTRARTRYDAEKEEVFFETKRGVIEPALHLERLASYTSDLDDVQIMPSSSRVPMCNYHGATNELDPNNSNEPECPVDPHRQLMLDILTTTTTVKFGWSLRVCIAALPTAFQFGIGLYLRTRPGGACPTTPRVAGWFGLFGGHSTLPTQVVVTLLALWPCRALAPFAALIAAGLQLIWNGSLLMTLAAVAGPMDTTATCFPARLFRLGRGVSWTVSSVFTEVITAGAATMFAMHVRPRASNPTPVSLGGLMLIALVLLAVQFARAAVVGFILPTRGEIGNSLHCAVDAGGQGAVYAFGRFAGLI